MAPPQQFVAPQPRTKRRKWPWIALGVLLVLVIAAIASSGSKNSSSVTSAVNASTSPSPVASVSHDLGSKDASNDVKFGAISVDPTLGLPSVPVVITNHSSKRSNYLMSFALESADGRTQIDTGDILVQYLEPGQTTTQIGQFMTRAKLPPGAKVVLLSVDRLVS